MLATNKERFLARSGFVTAFEGFWNTWACHRHNLMLVVCGSATSWIQDNFINGGIPYYMKYVEKGMSIDQAVNALFFDERARLKDEYDRMFDWIFLRRIMLEISILFLMCPGISSGLSW